MVIGVSESNSLRKVEEVGLYRDYKGYYKFGGINEIVEGKVEDNKQDYGGNEIKNNNNGEGFRIFG